MKKYIKTTIIVVVSLIAFLLVGVLGYGAYILISYNRIGDQTLEVTHNSTLETININEEYSCITYNLGFGAYSQDFTFFMDTGYDKNNQKTQGYYGKAKSKEEVLFNINGAIDSVLTADVDFIFFQEVDTNSTRSYHVNEYEMITEKFLNYDHSFAINFHSAYLPYPLYDMHGKSNSGIATFSKYSIQEAYRKEYTIAKDLSKLFDLDRCFSYSIVKVENGKNLYLVNSHMSAYDEGGKIRQKQLDELNAFLTMCAQNQDYVIVGGDFNHDLLTYNPQFNYDKINNRAFNMTLKSPDWISFFFDENQKSPLVDNYQVIAADNWPSCRNNDIEWDEEETFVCCVDGFIVSNNIEVLVNKNIKTGLGNKNIAGFAFSDHEPAYLSFKLK